MLFVRTRIQSCEQYVSPWQQCMILKMISQMERSTMERPWRNRLHYHGAPVPGNFVDRSLFVFAYNHANNFRKAKL